MCDYICERWKNWTYRSRQSLAVNVLLTLAPASVLIWYLIEHDALDSVVFGKPLETLCSYCSIVVKQEPLVSALTSGSREESDLYDCMEANGPRQYIGDFPRPNKAENPTIGDRSGAHYSMYRSRKTVDEDLGIGLITLLVRYRNIYRAMVISRVKVEAFKYRIGSSTRDNNHASDCLGMVRINTLRIFLEHEAEDRKNNDLQLAADPTLLSSCCMTYSIYFAEILCGEWVLAGFQAF